jgi:hypothetical protein
MNKVWVRACVALLVASLMGCEAEDVTDPVVAGTPDALADAAVDVIEEPDAQGVTVDAAPWPSVPPTFKVGGLLGRFTPGIAESPTDVPLDIPPTHLHENLRLNDSEGAFALLFNGGPFCGRIAGGIHVEETTSYTFTAVAGDSVQVRLDGIPVITAWNTEEVTTESVDLVLEKGWHPIELIFSSDPFRAVLELWIAKGDDKPQVVAHDSLGYVTKVPDNSPSLWGEVTVGAASPYGVDVSYVATGPARLKVDALVDGELVTVTSPDLGVEGALVVPLKPGAIGELSFALYDAWDRVVTLPGDIVFASPLPDFVPGGILGTYYSDHQHTQYLAQRLDPGIVFPESVGEGVGGSFGMPTSPDTFSVHWDGGIYAPTSGEYTLYWGTDDGQRVFVDGQLIAEDWTGHAPQYVSPSLYLAQGWHALRLEMYEAYGGAYSHLEWSGPDFVRHVTPPDVLGAVLPEDNMLPPEVVTTEVFTSWQMNNNMSFGRAILWFTANELSTAEIVMTTADDVVTNREMEVYSEGFRTVFDDVPSGPVIFYIYLTDRYGNTSLTTKTVFGEVPLPPEPEDD